MFVSSLSAMIKGVNEQLLHYIEDLKLREIINNILPWEKYENYIKYSLVVWEKSCTFAGEKHGRKTPNIALKAIYDIAPIPINRGI